MSDWAGQSCRSSNVRNAPLATEGDVLMATRLDRLARSTRDLLNVLHELAQSSAAFKSLHDHWVDTTTPHGRLMLTILGGLAEFARSLLEVKNAPHPPQGLFTGTLVPRTVGLAGLCH
jgi:hypothetical protein